MKTNDIVLSELSKVYQVVLALLAALGIGVMQSISGQIVSDLIHFKLLPSSNSLTYIH